MTFLRSVAFGQICRIWVGVEERLACKPRHVCLLARHFRDEGLCPEEAAGRKELCKHFAEMSVKRDVFRPSAALRCWAAVGRLSLQLARRTSTRLSTPNCSCIWKDCPQHLSQPLESAQGCSDGRYPSPPAPALSNFPALGPAETGAWRDAN